MTSRRRDSGSRARDPFCAQPTITGQRTSFRRAGMRGLGEIPCQPSRSQSQSAGLARVRSPSARSRLAHSTRGLQRMAVIAGSYESGGRATFSALVPRCGNRRAGSISLQRRRLTIKIRRPNSELTAQPEAILCQEQIVASKALSHGAASSCYSCFIPVIW